MKNLYKKLPLLLVVPLSACQVTYDTLEKHMFAFGTECHFTLYDIAGEKGEKSLDAFYKVIKTIDAYADSDHKRDVVGVYDLNETNDKLEISKDLYDILSKAKELGEAVTYFNPLVGSLSNKWKEALANGEVLDQETIDNETFIISQSSLVLENSDNKYYAQRVGEAKIDLGAMAKGYALDKCLEVSREVDCSDHIINLGRSSIGLGVNSTKKTKKSGYYSIRIEDLSAKYLYLQKSFVSTSGNSEQGTIVNGQMYSHIINPYNGDAISNYDEVIVITEESNGNGALGDALSTSLMMSELDEIKKAEADFNVGIIVIQDSNIYYKSESVTLYNANGQEIS